MLVWRDSPAFLPLRGCKEKWWVKSQCRDTANEHFKLITAGPCSASGSQVVLSQGPGSRAEPALVSVLTAGHWWWIKWGSIGQGELRGDVGWTVQIITLHFLFLFYSRLDSFPVNVLNSSTTKSLSLWPIRCQNQVCKSAFFDAVNWTGVLSVCSMFNTSFTRVMNVDHPLHILIPLSVCCHSLGSSHCWMSFTCCTELFQCPPPAWLEGLKPVRIFSCFEQSVMRDSMKHCSSGWSGSVACQDFLYRT